MPLRVLYAPTHYTPVVHQRVGYPTFPATWHFARLHMPLLRWMATRPEHFTWKAPEAEHEYNPVGEVIARERWSNIHLSTARMRDVLPTAHRVIVEGPFTVLMDALLAGLPVLGLSHSTWTVRPGAKAYFGCILQSFTTAEDAIRLVQQFLEDPDAESRYCVPVIEPWRGLYAKFVVPVGAASRPLPRRLPSAAVLVRPGEAPG